MQRMLLMAAVLGLIYATDQLHAQSGHDDRNPWHTDRWYFRHHHASVEFRDRLWIIGGSASPEWRGSSIASDVWSSADGENWRRETIAMPWEARRLHAVLVFNDRMWILGGIRGYSSFTWRNDVWSSADGVNWREETASAEWSRRAGHAATVFDGRMWIIGGLTDAGEGEAWSSSDGITWTLESTAPELDRRFHSLVVFNGRMWIHGGDDGMRDIWSSADGVTWTREVETAPWGARDHHAAVVFDGRQWIMGGSDQNDVWSSPDGVQWTQEADATWSGRTGHTATVFDSRLWVTGGTFVAGDVWTSDDGTIWTYTVPDPVWKDRSDYGAEGFANRLWVLGGEMDGRRNDVWSRTTDTEWAQEPQAPWTPRHSHATTVFNGRLWVIGGNDGSARNDIWSMAPNGTWRREADVSPWTPRYGHWLVLYDDRMWLIGGLSGTTSPRNDIWSSPDGVTWRLESPAGPWHAVGLNWIGATNLGLIANGLWYSADGVNWTYSPAAARYGFTSRAGRKSMHFDGRLWVAFRGGGIWSTPLDAYQWRAEGAPNSTPAGFDDRVWALGGASDEVWSLHRGWITVEGGPLVLTETWDGTPTAEKTLHVTTERYDGLLRVIPPTGFEVSLKSGEDFQSTSVKFASEAGGVTLYVRHVPNPEGDTTGDLYITSRELAPVIIPLSTAPPVISPLRTGRPEYGGCLAGDGGSLWVLALLAAGVAVSRRRKRSTGRPV